MTGGLKMGVNVATYTSHLFLGSTPLVAEIQSTYLQSDFEHFEWL